MPSKHDVKLPQSEPSAKALYLKPMLRPLGDLRTLTQGGNSGRREGPFGIAPRRVMN